MSHYNYSKAYTSDLLQGEDITSRAPLAQHIAKQYGNSDKKLFDIGCGAGEKSLLMLEAFQTVVGLEPSHSN